MTRSGEPQVVSRRLSSPFTIVDRCRPERALPDSSRAIRPAEAVRVVVASYVTCNAAGKKRASMMLAR
jgi:hypothetical protein